MSNTTLKLKRSAVKGKAPNTTQLELGELALNTVDGKIYLKTEDSSSVQAIHTFQEIFAGTGLTNSDGTIFLNDTTVTAGSYGNASNVPVLTINAQGQVTAASTVTVAGVSSISFDSSTGTFTVFTADGDSHSSVITLDPYTTSNLVEGDNLYYTLARVDSAFDARLATKTTDNLTEGSNLYYTQDRFNTAFLAKTTDSLSEGSLNLYYTKARTDSDIAQGFNDRSTADLAEDSSNKYYTTARVDSDFDARLATKTTTDVAEGTNLYYTTGRVDSDIDAAFAAKSTTDLSEGTNLYYTNARADARADIRFSVNFLAATTDSLSEGLTNLYYTTARQDSDFNVSFLAKNTDSLSEGTSNLYFTNARAYTAFDTRLATKTTTNLAEGNNLYYTTARADSDARSAISVVDAGGDGSLAYDSATGVLTYTGPTASEVRARFSGGTGVTITDGVVAIGQSVGTTDDVTFGKVIVDSADVNAIYLDKLTGAPSNAPGTLFYDSDPQKGLSFIPTTNEGVQDVTLNIGQEVLVYVHNLTGAQINNGQAVYVSGVAHGAHPQVTLAKADNASTARPLGLATQDIPDGAHGYVTKLGLVRDVDTTGMTPGGLAYLSKDSAGQWDTVEVSVDSGYPTHIGTVLTVGAQGTIFVDVEPEHFEYLRVQDKIITQDLEAPDIYGSHIHFDGKDPGYYAEGLIYYDSGNGALVVKNDEQEITLQVGQEEWIRVYNNSGSTITNGTPVYLSGTSNGLPSIVASDAVNSNGVNGIATHDIENGSVGYVTARGVVNDVNTQGISVGSKIHVGVGGGLTSNTIDYPNYPNDVGVCLVEDSVAGKIYVDIVDHTMETLRVTEDARFDANVTVGGNLNVIGVTTEVLSQSLTTSANLLQLLDGDTVGTAYQNVGGLNDATFKGKYTGDSDVYYFVRMFSVDSAAVGDTIEWGISDSDTIPESGYGVGFDSAGGPVTWNLLTDGLTAPLRNGLSIQFINLSGHDSADVWCAHPTQLNLDLGVIGNYNQANEPLKYAGVVRDATDERWKFFDGLPATSVDSSGAQFDINFDSATLSDIQFATAYGNLSGNASTSTTATQLATARTIGLTGDVTATGVSFNGTANITLTTDLAAGVVTNTEIAAGANIADTKLATISTAGKVQNSATTATASNTGSAIVTRDPSGNFAAGTITASLTGTASNASQLNNQNPSYYLDHTNFTNAPSAFTKFKIGTLDTFEPDSANDILELATGPGIVFSVDSASDKVIIDTKSTTPLVTDLFTAGAAQTDYVLSNEPISEDELMVFVEGVYQNRNSFSIAGSTLTLADSVATGSEVVVHQVGSNLVSGDVQFGQAVSGTRTYSFSSASKQTVATFDKTKYRSMNLQVQITDNTASEYEMSQVHLIHDGTTVTTTEFGTIFTGDSDLGDFDASISGNDLNLEFTATNANSKTIRLHFNAIKV